MYLNFMFLDQFLFELSYKNTHKHRNKHTHTTRLWRVLFANATIKIFSKTDIDHYMSEECVMKVTI